MAPPVGPGTLQADTPLRYLKGVGPRRAEGLKRAGLESVEDLLYVLPFRYEDRRAYARVKDLGIGGPPTSLDVRVVSGRCVATRRPGFTLFEARLADTSGEIRAVWYNQPYLARWFTAGRRAVVFGAVSVDRQGSPVLENPDYEILDDRDAEGIHTGRIVPVYRKLGDLSSRAQRALLHRALAGLDPDALPDRVPADVVARHTLLHRGEALRRVHFPPGEASLTDLDERRSAAHRALAFEEIYLLQLALAVRRRGLEQQPREIAYALSDALRTRLARLLPFRLTAAQRRVLREIGADLRASHPMHRLLQGDVGCGKTIVALLVLLVAVENGYQGVFVAPTEILADQHFRNFSALLERRGADYRLALLTGSLRAAERRRALARIASGETQLAIGTHALFEPDVRFDRLALVVVDEQHRFGVLQRAAIAGKGSRPDVLVMTATPIPRSLALTLYGDLDLSVIDELPPGRTPVRTVVRTERDRPRVYEGLRRMIREGRQAYVVVPLVEETAKTDLKAATAFEQELRERALAGHAVGLVHGRMRRAEKERVMRAFEAGEIQVLVATTVIEVGVDVANATVMIVEHAERFGLSQLHQLRGRVGRGAARSYCVLMLGESEPGPEARARLRIMEETTDGFRIAEKDLELRGPGAVFGTQQHGLSDLKFLASILRDPALLDAARSEALRLASDDRAGAAAARDVLGSLSGPWKRRLALVQVG